MHEHLFLPKYKVNLDKRRRINPGGGYKLPEGRNKNNYYKEVKSKAKNIAKTYQELAMQYSGKINPNLIYRINVNQSVGIENFEKSLNAMGEIQVLSVAENRQGYWVVFSNDYEFNVFQNKLAQYSGVVDGHKYDFFDAIETIEDIPIEEKIGPYLKENPLKETDYEYLDLELWRMDNRTLERFISELKQLFSSNNELSVFDELITNSFALYRIRASYSVVQEILKFKEVARVDRPFIPTFKLSDYGGIDIRDLDVQSPSTDAVGVLIIDSGIVSNHPLLEKSVGNEENFQVAENELQDMVGHGTAVAGISIYGDIKQSVQEKRFEPSNWLFSAKVMYSEEDYFGRKNSKFDKEKLLESQLYESITSFLDNDYYNIKVVNLSLGDKTEYLKSFNNRQFPLAALLDELALRYGNVVFVVSSGNSTPRDIYNNLDEIIENYPNYLGENDSFRIINPATSALSITVGSVAHEINIMEQSLDFHKKELWTPIADENEPSPFTRVGPGINNMLKPEVVHYGGNMILRESGGHITENTGGKLPLLSNLPMERLFTYDVGSSFSAPMVTNILGKIANKYPNGSANLLKNLLLQSTRLPEIKNVKGTNTDKKKFHFNSLGYGLPNYEYAIASFDNRVVLLDEATIGLNKIQVYSVDVPKLFFETKGHKRVSVALTFNPPTRMTRGDSYLGNQLEFKLFHTLDSDIIVNKFAEVDLSDEEQLANVIDKKYEIVMDPGIDTRKKGCHQKGVKEYKREPQNIPTSPFTLVIINSNKWINDLNYTQDYCVSMVIEHIEEIKLYNKIRNTIQSRVRIR